MRKLGWFLIAVLVIVLVWAVVASNIPAVGQGTKTLFIDILGTNIVNGAVGISNNIMIWGASGFPQALTVLLGTGIFFLAMGVIFTRVLWPRRPAILGKKTPIAPTYQPQAQLSTPTLYTPQQQAPQPVIQPEEKKEAPTQ